jgi:hypothetical protein
MSPKSIMQPIKVRTKTSSIKPTFVFPEVDSTFNAIIKTSS